MHTSHGGSFVIADTAYLYATVIGDESSGNLYKQLYIQDETGGINLQLEESAANVRIGDYVKIVLNGLSVSSYNNLMQLGGIEPAYDIIVQRNECYIEPELVTIKQLNSSNFAYTCKLVKIEDVQFSATDTLGTYADGYALTSKNLTLTDSLGNEVLVRNSGYANFANKKVISGRGNAVFIVSRYGSTVQLLIRSIGELDMNSTRFGGGGDAGSNIMFQSFENGFGAFAANSVSGDQTWAISYSTATMTGYANSTNYDNEDWLISSEIDLTNESVACFSMSYIARYFSDLDNDITLQVSTNYTAGSAPSSATWTAVPASWTSGSDWNTFATTNVDISSFAGKKITLAIKYLSTSKKAGTIEIKSIGITNKVENGANSGTTDDGTFEKPLGVSDAMTATGTKWVKGYIVGVYETKDANGATLDKYVMSTKAPFYTNTNILIAASATETDLSKCMTVQLPTGDIRKALNLVENASNLGKEVMIYGSLEKYFNMPGVKSLTGYWLNGNGIKPDDGGSNNGGNTDIGNSIFAESFKNGQGQFVIHNVEIGSLSYVWSKSNYKDEIFMKASAYYNKTNIEAESWLVSPAITLSSGTATLSFRQAANYVSNPKDALHVMISTDFNGDVSSADWTELNNDISKWSTDFTFVTSTVDLSAYAGETIYVAFQYTSTDSEAATWEINDFKIE